VDEESLGGNAEEVDLWPYDTWWLRDLCQVRLIGEAHKKSEWVMMWSHSIPSGLRVWCMAMKGMSERQVRFRIVFFYSVRLIVVCYGLASKVRGILT